MKNLITVNAVILLFCILTGCSAAKLTQQYKNPETDNFQANKILIVGISADKDLRRLFEKKMVESLEIEDVIAVKSIDFFEKSFIDNKQSLEQLSNIENKLLEAGFDAILFTKITGQESRVNLVESYRNFAKYYQSFEDYYYGNQHLYFKEKQERYQVYTTETSLYCICLGKGRELLWRGEIEVVDASKLNQNINSYITVLFKNLKLNNVLLLNE
jgi:ribosomal protein S17E